MDHITTPNQALHTPAQQQTLRTTTQQVALWAAQQQAAQQRAAQQQAAQQQAAQQRAAQQQAAQQQAAQQLAAQQQVLRQQAQQQAAQQWAAQQQALQQQAAQLWASQQQAVQPPLLLLNKPYQPAECFSQAPPPAQTQALLQPPPNQSQQPLDNFQEQRLFSPQIPQHMPSLLQENRPLQQLRQPAPQPAVEGQQAPKIPFHAANSHLPAQVMPQQGQSKIAADADPRGGPQPSMPNQTSQSQATKEYWHFDLAMKNGLPDALHRALRQNWKKCFTGSISHQTFLLRNLLEVTPPDAAQTCIKSTGRKLWKDTIAEKYEQMSTSGIDSATAQILARASNKFLDAALDIRLRSIDAKSLVNALARARRLGYEPDETFEQPSRDSGPAVYQEMRRDASAGADADAGQQPPPSTAVASSEWQCAVCGKQYTTETALTCHISSQICMPGPMNKKGLVHSGPSSQQSHNPSQHEANNARKNPIPSTVPAAMQTAPPGLPQAVPQAVPKSGTETGTETSTKTSTTASRNASTAASSTDNSKSGTKASTKTRTTASSHASTTSCAADSKSGNRIGTAASNNANSVANSITSYTSNSKYSSKTNTTASRNASCIASSTASRTADSKSSNGTITTTSETSTTASRAAGSTASCTANSKYSAKTSITASRNASCIASRTASRTADSKSSNETSTTTISYASIVLPAAPPVVPSPAPTSKPTAKTTPAARPASRPASQVARRVTVPASTPARKSSLSRKSPRSQAAAHLTEKEMAALHNELLQCEEMLNERLRNVKDIADPVQRRKRLGNLKQTFTTQRSAIREKYGVQNHEHQSPSEERHRSVSGQKLMRSLPNKRAFDDLHQDSTITDPLSLELAAPRSVKRARTDGDIESIESIQSDRRSRTTPASQGRRQGTATKSTPISIANKSRTEQQPTTLAGNDMDDLSDSSSDDDDIPARLPDLVLQSLSASHR
ncbi:hypothetical protein SEPCBS119000_006191 [Sporothrix epigloea]|uniref:C2H2-type domain-containing protein n=1 Tax=Sporothrix epigloea TaxID=1892477 RepID=A0ABP0E1P8_9PEZI